MVNTIIILKESSVQFFIALRASKTGLSESLFYLLKVRPEKYCREELQKAILPHRFSLQCNLTEEINAGKYVTIQYKYIKTRKDCHCDGA